MRWPTDGKNLFFPIPQPIPHLIMRGLPPASCRPRQTSLRVSECLNQDLGNKLPCFSYWLTFVHIWYSVNQHAQNGRGSYFPGQFDESRQKNQANLDLKSLLQRQVLGNLVWNYHMFALILYLTCTNKPLAKSFSNSLQHSISTITLVLWKQLNLLYSDGFVFISCICLSFPLWNQLYEA